MERPRQFRRRDGVLGVGFLVQRGGRECYSIAWPDGDHQYLTHQLATELGISDLSAAEIEEGESEAEAEAKKAAAKLKEEQDAANAEIARAQEQRRAEEEARLNGSIIPTAMHEPVLAQGEQQAPDEELEQPTPPYQASEHDQILQYLQGTGKDVTNKSVVEAFALKGISITSAQVTTAKKALAG